MVKTVSRFVEWRGELREDRGELKRKKDGIIRRRTWRGELRE
tara:strand:+ start:178 stop:303 length:126 start_codon:yes stop_codon:yes gene_type:complete